MEPRIQYTKTSDGVSIAYAVMGQGPLLVMAGNLFPSNLAVLFRAPPVQLFLETVCEHFTVVSHDGRGTGLSDRGSLDYSLDARIRDLEAVLERLDASSFTLFAQWHGGMAAVAYAAAHPDRVSRLVLVQPYADGDEYYRTTPMVRFSSSFTDVAVEQWEFTTQAIAQRMVGGAGQEIVSAVAELLRESISPEGLLAFREASRGIDVTPLLPKVSAHTLIVHVDDDTSPLRLSQVFASDIPDAQMAVVAGPPGLPANGQATVAMLSFLGVEQSGAVPAAQGEPVRAATALQTILFTDVEGSTALTDRLGDAAAREVMRKHERITREALKAHGGSEVKTMGDGFMASFGSATKALECAVAIQKAFTDGDIRVRLGLNAGEPIAEDDPDGRADLHGTAVIVAARIAAQAHGGEILVSDVVRQLVAGKGFRFNDRGEHALKGFEDPVRVWEVRWNEPS